MNASEKDECRRCGAVVPATSSEKLCPACLLSGALDPPGSRTETLSMAPGGALSLRGPSDFPSEFGSYRLLGLLGRGGMGTVYEAEELSTGRRVALKTLGQQLDSPEMRQRFLREGRPAARVNHPNSLFVFGSEENEGRPVITMEIAGSGTLKDALKKRGPLPVAEAVDAVLDVISGLESAFAGGVLHRDIKPSNCFVSPDGSVKVGDFGLSVSTLAKTDTFVTAHGKIMGTPAYASPEQLRGDELDVRADIYSVGATLFTLLTDRAPFEGDNAVQVVANAVNQKPKQLRDLREDVPPGLERVVARCLAKEPDGRYADYTALRNALLPFSSKVPEPASMVARVSTGWIDYLIAFLPAYVILMFAVGAEELLVQPLVERTLVSAKYYFLLLGVGFLYFTVTEGIWGAGLGKWLKGLQVVRTNGRRPGPGRALIRILVPIACAEGIRMPLMMVLISDSDWTGFQTAMFVVAAIVCASLPGLLASRARRENGFATLWDLASGTRVVIKPKGTMRPSIEPLAQPEVPTDGARSLGPYRITTEMVPGKWIVGIDPVLRRQVWMLRRSASELPLARRNVARPGRQRWLQSVETADGTWDAYEATQGVPFSSRVEDGSSVPWGTLRHWLHDLASELWDASGDQTLPTELSLDHVWITAEGHAILLDEPWPDVKSPAERIAVGDVAGQQHFLGAVAACVESTSLPVHARPVLQNLENGKFEKLSFLTGTLRGLLDRPAEVSKGIRAGSIFMLPLYVWIAFFVGRYHDKPWMDSLGEIVIISALVDATGALATRSHLLARWAVVWLPLALPISFMAVLVHPAEGTAFFFTLVLLLLWVGAAVFAVVHPHRGLHDRLTGTWVVRR
jgi:uncharacterized RDD family membrane protein YckC